MQHKSKITEEKENNNRYWDCSGPTQMREAWSKKDTIAITKGTNFSYLFCSSSCVFFVLFLAHFIYSFACLCVCLCLFFRSIFVSVEQHTEQWWTISFSFSSVYFYSLCNLWHYCKRSHKRNLYISHALCMFRLVSFHFVFFLSTFRLFLLKHEKRRFWNDLSRQSRKRLQHAPIWQPSMNSTDLIFIPLRFTLMCFHAIQEKCFDELYFDI